jgi:hypothetical protein
MKNLRYVLGFSFSARVKGHAPESVSCHLGKDGANDQEMQQCDKAT